MEKPINARPGLYCMFYEQMKLIAKEYGYNLLVNGSLNRDLDLVAVPWRDNPRNEQEMIKDFKAYLTGIKISEFDDGKIDFTLLPGNRHAYTINLNRGDRHGEWVRFADEQYYIDISIVQLSK